MEFSSPVHIITLYNNSLLLLNTLTLQRAKKVVSNSLGLVDFAIGLVIVVLNLPDGQVLFVREIQCTEGL